MSHQSYLDYISTYFSTNEEFLAFQESLKKPLDKTISIVQSRNTANNTLQELEANGFKVSLSDYNPHHYNITKVGDRALGCTAGHILGHFYIQETAASLPASYIDIPMEGHILDMCAAPGGKTTQLADRCKIIGSKAIVRANEPDHKRLQVLESNIMRCGMENVILMQHNGEHFGTLLPETFDAILLDAPCSGEGTGFKSDFGTKFRDIHKINQIAHLQYTLLESALRACKVGGQIMYSTCTINTVENEENIIKLMDQYGDYLEIEEIHDTHKSLNDGIIIQTGDQKRSGETSLPSNFKRLRPHIQHTGGFFMCKLRKKASLETKTIEKKNPFKIKPKYNICNQLLIRNWLMKHFGITVDDHYMFTQFQNQIYLTHTSIGAHIPFVNIYTPGLLVIKGEKEQDRRPVHSAGIIRNRDMSQQLSIDDDQLTKHLHQEDFMLTEEQLGNSKVGFVQLIYNSGTVGIAKIIGNNAKNKFSGIN